MRVWLDGMAGKRLVPRSISDFQCIVPLAAMLSLMIGCNQGPKRVPMPDFDPGATATRAIAALDNNGDGTLSQAELKDSPGLQASLSIFDADGDHQISRDELATTLRQWREEQAGLIEITCEVTWKGQPLKGATVRMVPEPYFDGSLAPATGKTDQFGQANMGCDKAHLPEALKTLRAVQPGIYRVEVTHPEIDLPAEYNTNTRLGRSVSLRNMNSLKLDL